MVCKYVRGVKQLNPSNSQSNMHIVRQNLDAIVVTGLYANTSCQKQIKKTVGQRKHTRTMLENSENERES